MMNRSERRAAAAAARTTRLAGDVSVARVDLPPAGIAPIPPAPPEDCTPQRRSAADIFNHGLAALHATPPDHATAYRLFASAVQVDPDLAVGWFGIGNANGDMNLLPAAVAAYRRGLLCVEDGQPGGLDDDLRTKLEVNLGHRLYHMGQHDEARWYTQAVLERRPNDPNALCNMSLIHSVAGRHEEAIEFGRRAWRAAPNDPIIETGYAFSLLFAGRLAEGLHHFEARFPYKLPQYLKHPYPVWKGEPLEGRTLFICADQGLGDTLSFLRFVPLVATRAAKVVMLIQAELVRFASAMFQAFPNVEIMAMPGSFPPADYWISPMSLPLPLGLTDAQIAAQPDLPAPPFRSAPTWKIPGRKLHVGICWAGSPMCDIEKWRTVPLEMFLSLYDVPGVQLYSLQKGPRAEELHKTGAGSVLRDLGPYINDVGDTMGILRELDLVVTIETSLGHMAGVLGSECWVLYAHNGGDWRIGRGEDGVLWYKRHRIFKQGTDAKWEPVIERVKAALRERVNVHRTP
jgi:tetratricopeptide (TPR) repeat protein